MLAPLERQTDFWSSVASGRICTVKRVPKIERFWENCVLKALTPISHPDSCILVSTMVNASNEPFTFSNNVLGGVIPAVKKRPRDF